MLIERLMGVDQKNEVTDVSKNTKISPLDFFAMCDQFYRGRFPVARIVEEYAMDSDTQTELEILLKTIVSQQDKMDYVEDIKAIFLMCEKAVRGAGNKEYRMANDVRVMLNLPVQK